MVLLVPYAVQRILDSLRQLGGRGCRAKEREKRRAAFHDSFTTGWISNRSHVSCGFNEAFLHLAIRSYAARARVMAQTCRPITKLGIMSANPQVTFQTNFFKPVPGEEEETNPGRYGKALAQWLAECQGQPNFPRCGNSNFPTRLRFVVE